MAICLHALSALMLTDFRLTTFFETSHGFGILGYVVIRTVKSGDLCSENDFREGVFNDSFCSELFEVRNEVACNGVLNDGLKGNPSIFCKM